MCCTASPRKPHPSPPLRKSLMLTLRLGFILGIHLFPSNIMASTNAYRVGRSARRTLTCDMCKTRHQKCNGAQPQCSNCELRAITCSYSNQRAQGPDYALRPPELALRPSSVPRRFLPCRILANPLYSTESSAQTRLSETEYDRLHAQIYEDIVGVAIIHLPLQ